MNLSIFQAVIMGLTQGLAEFLPISSSGSAAGAEAAGIPSTGLLLEVLLHVGTLVAVFVRTLPAGTCYAIRYAVRCRS